MVKATVAALRATWAGIRHKKREKRAMSILKSKTSATIAGSAAVGGSTALAAISFLRSYWPSMPGDATTDAALSVFLMTWIVPVLGRLVAAWRGKV